MFFKKKKATPDPVLVRGEPYWRERDVKAVAASDHLEVLVTGALKRIRYGKQRDTEEEGKPGAYDWEEIIGIMEYPREIAVSISFTGYSGGFGGWRYSGIQHWSSLYKNEMYPLVKDGRPVEYKPLLMIEVSHRHAALGDDLAAALRTSILCGRQDAAVRFWKRGGEGLLSPKDQERGFTQGSSYSILGASIWDDTRADGVHY